MESQALPSPGYEWLVAPSPSKPVGIARKLHPGAIREWYYLIVGGGLTQSVGSEKLARKVRTRRLRAQP